MTKKIYSIRINLNVQGYSCTFYDKKINFGMYVKCMCTVALFQLTFVFFKWLVIKVIVVGKRRRSSQNLKKQSKVNINYTIPY